MKKLFFTLIAGLFCFVSANAQIPTATLVQISRNEDARRYDDGLKALLTSTNALVRERAALAAGRIGDEKALADLEPMIADSSVTVAAMAVFAMGEIESVKGAAAVLKILGEPRTRAEVLARAVEAAGKIAAANAKDKVAGELGAAIVKTLQFENARRSAPDIIVVRLALTAALRAHPVGANEVVQRFLSYSDPDVVADALNTLSRLRAKNANRDARDLLGTSQQPLVRANAARLLGVAEDKDAFDLLLKAAISDTDSRVRVSAIRSLASLKNVKAADPLLERGKNLLGNYEHQKTENRREKGEALEIATVIGRLLANTENAAALKYLTELNIWGGYRDPETTVAFARVAPHKYIEMVLPDNIGYRDFRAASAYSQGLAEIASTKDPALIAQAGVKLTDFVADMATAVKPADQWKMVKAMPELTTALAQLKPDNIDQILRGQITNEDLFIRTAAAEAIANRPLSKENVEALKKAFDLALIKDKDSDDAQLATLSALYKLDKKESVGSLLLALNATDYLVRKKAFDLLADMDLQKDFPGISASLEIARSKHKDQVLPFTSAFGTKLGQVLNTEIDYRRAVSRKNGSVKAVLTTGKGTFTINFTPEDAPLTVDNFVKLARSGYFNGLEVHRVVPNFVMQDGDPRSDGNGGPGWSIRCEVNMLPFDRGAVGMALSGKDTGGSQWFVTHAPQPHLDGGYTVFGHVNETDMKIVDSIVRGDKIISVKIIEGILPRKGSK